MKISKLYHRELLIEKTKKEIKTIRRIVPLLSFEPKFENKFIVEFPAEFQINTFLVQKVNKPQLIDYVWDVINIFLLDIVEFSTTQVLYEVARLCKHRKNKNPNKDIFEFSIFMLNGTGERIEHWTIKVDNIDFDFGICDYDSDNMACVKMIIKPKDCLLSYE